MQDTISLGRWTINAGLRYDDQTGQNDGVVSPGNAVFPTRLPDINYDGERGFSWSNVLPRLGVTYALGEERKTLIRGSFSQFAQQLASATVRASAIARAARPTSSPPRVRTEPRLSIRS